MALRVFLLFIISITYIAFSTGMFPEIPRTIDGATVEFKCANGETCGYTGTLRKSFSGTYKLRVDDEVYFQSHSDDLASSEGKKFRFDRGVIRQIPVAGTLND